MSVKHFADVHPERSHIPSIRSVPALRRYISRENFAIIVGSGRAGHAQDRAFSYDEVRQRHMVWVRVDGNDPRLNTEIELPIGELW